MAEPTYTVFVRVPMPRGDFVDPPQVDWDSGRDETLWKILSDAAQKEIDWNQIAESFDVPVDFLLQQVAYLTERHASQVRAQVRKATAAAKGSAAPSPIPGSESAVAVNPRTASALSVRRDSPLPRNDGSISGTSPHTSVMRPVVSRNTSTNTAVPRDAGSSSPRSGKSIPARGAEQANRRRLSSLTITSTTAKSPEPQPEPEPPRSPSPGPAESSSTTSSSNESSPAQSRIIRRPPRFHQQDASRGYGDDGEESEPAFQPYQEPVPTTQTSAQDLASTLREDRSAPSRRRSHKEHKDPGKKPIHRSQTSDSSGGSAAVVHRPPKPPKPREQRPTGPLSPRRVAEVGGRSPSGATKGTSREGSDGTPSMGSSFSDLDDASVTQSALEEQMASHMNRGAGSRFSISQAIRSRYHAGSNQ